MQNYAYENQTQYYQPGNGTKYTITAFRAPHKPGYFMFMLDYWQTFMYVTEGSVPHWTYIQEKLKVSSSDAKALEEFFKDFWANDQ